MDETPHDGLRALTKQECLTLLRSSYVGRVGYVDGERPVIVPVNYRVDEDGAVLFLTGAGNKLEHALAERTLCLEVDEVDPLYKSGWSVLVTGPASLVDDREAAQAAQDLRLRPWARDVPRTSLVRIAPEMVEGRRLRSGS